MGKKCILENCNEDAFSFYPHCKKHLEQIKTGEVYKDENGKWKEKQTKKILEIKNNNFCKLCGYLIFTQTEIKCEKENGGTFLIERNGTFQRALCHHTIIILPCHDCQHRTCQPIIRKLQVLDLHGFG